MKKQQERRSGRKWRVALVAAALGLALAGCSASAASSHEHEWEAATCETPRVCKTCGETDGEPLGHTWQEATCLAPKTCTVCGKTEGRKSEDHVWGEPTCTEREKCVLCGRENLHSEPLGHDWIAPTLEAPYVLGPYRKLWVYVPKKRLVMALDYPDRIVQWSLYLYLNPIYDRLFIEDSYACRKDKGSHKAAKRLQYWMCQVQRKPGPGWYCLKLDISKYFYRVNHEKLLAILERRVKDPAMMAFIRGVVNSRAEPFGLPRWRTPQDTPPEEWLYEVGMPIGNLTSQLFANIYLNELDQYCKHRLKIHYYIRYMDDVIILGQDKETLHRWKAAVETFLREELALDLNSKTSIRPVRQGVEFVGVRIWPTHMKLRKSTVRRIKREVRKQEAKAEAAEVPPGDMPGA